MPGRLHGGNNGRISGIHPPGQRAKSGQYHPSQLICTAADNGTGAADTPVAQGQVQARVKMARYLILRFARAGLVTQDDPVILRLIHHTAHVTRGARYIVVAGDPDPIDRAGQRFQHTRCLRFHARKSSPIMKRIAKAINPPRARFLHGIGQAPQRFPAVVWRQHLPVCGEKTRLFKM